MPQRPLEHTAADVDDTTDVVDMDDMNDMDIRDASGHTAYATRVKTVAMAARRYLAYGSGLGEAVRYAKMSGCGVRLS